MEHGGLESRFKLKHCGGSPQLPPHPPPPHHISAVFGAMNQCTVLAADLQIASNPGRGVDSECGELARPLPWCPCVMSDHVSCRCPNR